MTLYLICFFVSVFILLVALGYSDIVDINIILLAVVVCIGNGGFYALALSTSPGEAIFANLLTYFMGAYAPLLIFLSICTVCDIRVPNCVKIILYGIQLLILLSASTIGKSGIFYSDVEFVQGENASHLIKSYGPMHSVHVGIMILYTLAGICIALYSLNRKNVVSRANVYILLLVGCFSVGVYLVERIVNLEVELLPVILAPGTATMLALLIKIYRFSVYNNRNITDISISETGFIFFDMKLRYRGCSEYASVLYPELLNWELEKKIPGNGGRFNTFLRRPLMDYVENNCSEKKENTYINGEEAFHYVIEPLMSSPKKQCGYMLRLTKLPLEAVNKA